MAIREGRAVADPRDAELAAAWADNLAAKGRRFPWWVLPLTRPRGPRAWLWVAHLVWITVAIVYAYVRIFSLLPGAWRWVLLGCLGYAALTTPITMRQLLRAYWNAPQAAERNRRLARDDIRAPQARERGAEAPLSVL